MSQSSTPACQLVDRQTGLIQEIPGTGGEVTATSVSDIHLDIDASQILGAMQASNDLIINLVNGTQFVVRDFYAFARVGEVLDMDGAPVAVVADASTDGDAGLTPITRVGIAFAVLSGAALTGSGSGSGGGSGGSNGPARLLLGNGGSNQPTAAELALAKINAHTRGGSNPPTVADYRTLDITGVNTNNLNPVNNRIADSDNDNLTPRDIQDLVNAVNNGLNNNPPDGNGNPPDGNGNPPGGDGNPPDGNGNPPDGNDNPPDGNGNPPDGNGNPPDGNGNPPDGNGNPPDGNGNPPDGNGNPPDGNGNPPDGNGNPPDGNGNPPDGNGNPPDGNGNPPDSNNNAPTFIANAAGANLSFTEGQSSSAALRLFSGANVNTIEPDQTLNQLILTISNIHDGNNEFLRVNGMDVELTAGANKPARPFGSGADARAVTVTIVTDADADGEPDATATVTINVAGNGLTPDEFNNLVNNLRYRNSSEDPEATGSNRTVTITSVRETSGLSSAALAVAATVNVTGVNDAPVIDTTDAALIYIERASATEIDPRIRVSDVDDATLASVTVAITANYQRATGNSGGDVLAFNNTNQETFGDIRATLNSNGDTLTLTSANGEASLTQWQAALRAVTFHNTDDDPSNLSRTVTFTATDTDADNPLTATATRVIEVSAVNPALIIRTTGAALPPYIENAEAPAQVGSTITVSVTDASVLASATVEITGGYQQAVADNEGTPRGDFLSFVNDDADTFGDITGSYDNGILTLTLSASGTATLTQWQAALQAVTYYNNGDDPGDTTRTISFRVTDSDLQRSATVTRDITVMPVNDAPTLDTTDTALDYTENADPAPVDPTITVDDVDGTTLTMATVEITGGYQQPVTDNEGTPRGDFLDFENDNENTFGDITGSYDNGILTLTLSPDGEATLTQWQAALQAVTYHNNGDDPGDATRTVSFQVTDSGSLDSATVTRRITVMPVNDAPTFLANAAGADLIFTEGQENLAAVRLFSGANVNTIEPDQNLNQLILTITNIQNGDNEFLRVNGMDVELTAGANKPARPYGSGAAARAVTVTIVTDADADGEPDASARVTINVAGNGLTPGEFNSLVNNLRYRSSSQDPEATGSDRTVTIISVRETGGPLSAVVAVAAAVEVTGVNDAPEIDTTDAALMYIANANATEVDPSITVSDVDGDALASATVAITAGYQRATGNSGGDVLAFTNTNQETFGDITATPNSSGDTLTLTSENGRASLTQWQAALGAVTFRNTADDPGNLSRTVTFTVTDTDTDNPQTATATRVIEVSAVDPALMIRTTETEPALPYIENADDPAPVGNTITVSVTDASVLASATIEITGGYQEPVADNERILRGDFLSFENDDANTFGDITGSDDNGILTLSLSVSGTATLTQWRAALQAVTYHNNSDDPGDTSRIVSFRVTDSDMHRSATVTRQINVMPVNDAPEIDTTDAALMYIANADATEVDPSITVSDVDGDALASATVAITAGYQRATGNSGGDVLAFNNTNQVTFGDIRATLNSDGDTLTLTSANGRASLTQWQAALGAVTFRNTADEPSNVSRTVTFTVTDTDTDNPQTATATRVIEVSAVDPALMIRTTGTGPALSYIENADESAPVGNTITVSVTDDGVLASARIKITGGYQEPVADNERILRGDFLSFENDDANIFGDITGSIDNGTLTLALSPGGEATQTQWQAALQAVTYYNNGDDPGDTTRTVSFRVTDNDMHRSATVTRQVNVMPVNDAPTLEADAAGSNLIYREDADNPVGLFKNAMVSTVESGQWLTQLVFTVTGVVDGGNEKITISKESGAPDEIPLVTGNGNAGGYSYEVSLDGTEAEVTLTLGSGISAQTAEDLIDGLGYRNDDTDDPTEGPREVTLDSLQDNGNGDDTWRPEQGADPIAATVNFELASGVPGTTPSGRNLLEALIAELNKHSITPTALERRHLGDIVRDLENVFDVLPALPATTLDFNTQLNRFTLGIDSNGNRSPNTVVRMYVNDSYAATAIRYDFDANGMDNRIDEYDYAGERRTKVEIDSNGNGTIDAEERYQVLPDGRHLYLFDDDPGIDGFTTDRVQIHTVNAAGHRTRTDFHDDGTTSTDPDRIERYKVNNSGQRTEIRFDYKDDEILDRTEEYELNSSGYITQTEISTSNGGSYTHYHRVNANGHRTRTDFDIYGSPRVDRLETYELNNAGQRTKTFFYDNAINLSRIETYALNGAGHRTSTQYDNNGRGGYDNGDYTDYHLRTDLGNLIVSYRLIWQHDDPIYVNSIFFGGGDYDEGIDFTLPRDVTGLGLVGFPPDVRIKYYTYIGLHDSSPTNLTIDAATLDHILGDNGVSRNLFIHGDEDDTLNLLESGDYRIERYYRGGRPVDSTPIAEDKPFEGWLLMRPGASNGIFSAVFVDPDIELNII